MTQLTLILAWQFLPVSVVQLIECEGRLINVEPLLEGKYVKHNDNDGNVESKEKVPQAFSHFTHHISNRRLLVCDIQGVGTFYTDPQVALLTTDTDLILPLRFTASTGRVLVASPLT